MRNREKDPVDAEIRYALLRGWSMQTLANEMEVPLSRIYEVADKIAVEDDDDADE